jgi:hypothetical protein
MNALLLAAAAILLVVGIAHSYLGERYILIRLFRRTELPRVWGSDVHTRRILRFAWHITTLAWWGFGAILIAAARPAGDLSTPLAGKIIALTSFASALMVLVWSRGRHLAWIAFLAVAVLVWFGVN